MTIEKLGELSAIHIGKIKMDFRLTTEEAEDLAQDALITAINRIGDFKGDPLFLDKWYFRILHRKVLDYVNDRAKIKERIHERCQRTYFTILDPKIDSALGILTDREREIVLFISQNGERSFSELGLELNLHRNTVGKIYKKSIEKLRGYLNVVAEEEKVSSN